MNTPLQILQQYWKHDRFNPKQEEIISSLLDGNDTFALLPTGGGKSICFQIPALLKEGICIVISPLIALMQDQVQNLKSRNIKAIALPSGIKYAELDALLDNCIYGNYKFLYLSPERLQQDIVQDRIKQMKVNCIAVDEAHCISQWGNDFRPSYKKIRILRNLHPAVPVIALTASATPQVVQDIVSELDLFQPNIFRQTFYRANLAYHVKHTVDKNYELIKILKTYPGSSIVYVRNRKASIDISDFLNANGYSSSYYHGGVSSEDKTTRFKKWLEEDIRVMVATNAFGMGIDKPNVRTVIHYTLPESIESYFQEAGRAGRDRKPSLAFLLKNKTDDRRLYDQFIKVLPNVDDIKVVYKKLCNYFQISYGEGEQSTFNFDFNTFCKTYELNHLITYNALQFLDRCGVIRFIQRFTKKSNLLITTTGNQLLKYLETNTEYELIVKAILRTYGGIFDEETDINIPLIASRTNTSEKNIISTLQKLQIAELLTFNYQVSDSELIFLVPREDERTINRIKHHLIAQNSSKANKVKAILNFANDTNSCKSSALLSYFGEKDTQDCGICSFCITNQKNISTTDIEKIKNDIIKLLKVQKLSSRALIDKLTYPEELTLSILREMNEKKMITIDHYNNYQIV
ncbi:RecQ family ATP-dependent DNA helicase [Aquimarina algicola]|uniref:ATP-dependent DNA helicase RecQ n=1 Tax=Aquimarina algicola TaxID=2589995 RepID=A0A504JNA3_9FLAO|nr:ATP-dependent DNA helicase RecQ [Aquimarina algicola]TPN89193.1 RecQ family ATP-dependent DNA helicase [Aquimarina algicola]